jgi:hypothetical protein
MPVAHVYREASLLVELLIETVDAGENCSEAIADVPALVLVVAPDKDVVQEALDLAVFWVYDDIQHLVVLVSDDALEVSVEHVLDDLSDERGLQFANDVKHFVAAFADAERICGTA